MLSAGQTWLRGLKGPGVGQTGAYAWQPHPAWLGTSPLLPGKQGEDGPLTQKGVPQGVLGSLLAAGPEMALGVSDLEAGLLPDGGGGGIWGKPKFPQVAASPVGKEVVGDGDYQRTGPSGAGWGLVGGPFCPGSPPGRRNLPCPAYFFPPHKA